MIQFVSFLSFSQETMTKYVNSFIDSEYNIQVDLRDDNDYMIFIDAYSMDNIIQSGGFGVTKDELGNFINNLDSALIKYESWTEIAKTNNVNSLNKEIDIESKATLFGYFLLSNEWNYDYVVKPVFEYKILTKNDSLIYSLIVRSGKLVSSKNEYINCDGVLLVFCSGNEIKSFINSISPDKIDEFKSNSNKQDLFK